MTAFETRNESFKTWNEARLLKGLRFGAALLVILAALFTPAVHGQEAEAPEAPAEAATEAGGADEAGGQADGGGTPEMTAEQEELVHKFLEVLKDSMVLMVGWGSAALLAFLIPIPWIVIAFKNEKGWGVILLIVYALGCVTPLTALGVAVYGLKHRLEYKKLFLVTVLIYAGFFGSSGYVGHRVQELAGEMESLAADAENMELDQQEADAAKEAEAEAGKKAEPASALGRIMEKAKAVADQASERSKTADKAMESGVKEAVATAEKATAESAAATADTTRSAEAKPAAEPAAEPAPKEGFAAAPRDLRVVTLFGTDKRRTAMIAGSDGKNHPVSAGDKVSIGGKDIEVIEITAEAVIIKMEGRAAPMALRAPKPKE